ncbi:MAG: hypothetical protein NVS1B11_14360 [Terriglobales bacterium]
MGNLTDNWETFYDPSDNGLANPAESEADDGNSQLHAVDDRVQIAVKLLDNPGAETPGLDELLDSRLSDAYQGELSCRKECIGRNQEQDQEDPEQHKSDHGWAILAFERA